MKQMFDKFFNSTTMTTKQGKILIVDDNEDILFALNLLLQPHVEKVKVTTQPERIAHFIETFAHEVSLLDMNFTKDADMDMKVFWLKDKGNRFRCGGDFRNCLFRYGESGASN